MENKILIQRCDGTKYYRKKKEIKFEKNIFFRYNEDKINKLKEIAAKKNIRYQALMKQILDDYIESEVN